MQKHKCQIVEFIPVFLWWVTYNFDISTKVKYHWYHTKAPCFLKIIVCFLVTSILKTLSLQVLWFVHISHPSSPYYNRPTILTLPANNVVRRCDLHGTCNQFPANHDVIERATIWQRSFLLHSITNCPILSIELIMTWLVLSYQYNICLSRRSSILV
jgi:hypothetical protein